VATPRRAGRPPEPTDLRERILDACLRLLEEPEGAYGVTIARVTKLAVCTAPSLYNYWPSREALLAEASARGWEHFQRTQAAADDLGAPLDRLRARGTSYLMFAIEHPNLFSVLFLSRATEGNSSPTFEALVTDVAEAVRTGALPPVDPRDRATDLWAAVHGVSVLAYANPAFAEHAAIPTLARLTHALLPPA